MAASIKKAPSIFYYLDMEEGQDPEKTLFSDATGLDGKPTYYDSLAASDPLAVQAVWAGALARGLGYPRGAAVSKQALAACWFGIDPKDGVSSLLKDGPSVAAQVKAQQDVGRAEAALFNATDNLKTRRVKLFNAGMSRELVEDDARVKKLTEDVEKFKAALDEAKAADANRANAHDVTFSAPKGVSVLWARYKTEGANGDAESAAKALAMETAMQQSVADVVENYIERHLVFTRSRQGSNKERAHDNVKGIAAALFMHFDARPTQETIEDPNAPGGKRIVDRLPDPQMHIHALLMNMGLEHDDEIRALWTNFLKSHIKVIGAAFRGELAHKLRAMGLDLQVDEQEKIMSFDVAGVSEEVAGKFSARRAQVVANLAEGMGSEDAVLEGRAVKSAFTGEELIGDWNRRMDEMGLTSRAIEATTNAKLAAAEAEEALARADEAGALQFVRGSAAWDKEFERRFNAAVARMEGAPPSVDDAVTQLLEMETAFSLTDIHRVSFEASQFCSKLLAPDETPMEWAEDFRAAILSHRELKRVHGLDEYGRPTFTSNGLLRREKELYFQSVPAMLAPRADILSKEAVESALADYETSQTALTGKAFKLEGFQRDMVHEVARNPGSIHIALAPAGSGKTTSILGAVMAFEALGGRVFSLAPSIKAAQGLASGIRKKRADGISPEAFINAVKRGSIVLTSKDVILMDEASMVGFENAKGVVDAALKAAGGPARTVWIGDTEQLPSVGRGNFLRTLAESQMFSAQGGAGVATVSKVAKSAADWVNIQRQNDDLGKQATTYFALGQTAKAIEIYERMGALTLSTTREQALEGLAFDAYLPLTGAAEDYNAVLAPRDDRYRAFAKRGNSAALNVARAKGGACSEEDFIAAFAPEERETARQWFEDKVAIDKARSPLIKAYSDTLILATKKADVAELNLRARDILKSIGALGGVDGQQRVTIPRGRVGLFEICEGERLAFTEKADSTLARFSVAGDMAAKTTVGTVLAISKNKHGDVVLTMQLDGQAGGLVEVNTKIFDKFSYSYALTAHSSQGATCQRVYKYLSSFASMQTEYVGDSRHKEILAMRAVESEYALYKKRAAEAIEKTDAKDLAFAANYFNLEDEQLSALDKSWESGQAEAALAAQRLEASRMRTIAQGALLEHGAAPLGFQEGRQPSYYAKLMVRGRPVTLWGAGLERAIAELGAAAGDHVGLEALSGSASTGAIAQWRSYSSEQLGACGLLMDEAGLAARAAKVMSARSGADKSERESMEELVETKFMSDKEALAVAQSVIARASEVAALRAQERGVLDALNKMAELPADLDQRLAMAKDALPFAKSGSGDKIRHALASGITAMPYARPMIQDGREWLASDAELTYCVTEWGAVEAWSSAGLSDKARAEAAQGGKIERLAERRLEAVELGRRVAVDPLRQAFGALGDKLEICIVEHAEHGMCVGVNARVAGTHRTDPELQRLFTGEGAYGQEASKKKNGIGGLRRCKGFDKTASAWLFPLSVDALGTPKGAQPAVAELMELGERLGHSVMERSAWDVRRAETWDRIESRLASPWGLAFGQSCAEMGVAAKAKNGILSGFAEKSNDIVRWDDASVDDGVRAEHWSMCPNKDKDGKVLEDGSRRLAGVVLHADAQDVFVMNGFKILAIGRELLGLEGAAEDLIGRRVAVAFQAQAGGAAAIPTLESIELDPVLEKGRALAARISAGESLDRAKMKAIPGLEAAFARATQSDAKTPESAGYALAWARREATHLGAVRVARAEGIEKEAGAAEPLEAYAAPGIKPKQAKVLAIGSGGVLISIGAKKFLADKEQMRMALPRQLTVGKTISALHFVRDAAGRVSIDAAATARRDMGLTAT